jgi:hypothetical protein
MPQVCAETRDTILGIHSGHQGITRYSRGIVHHERARVDLSFSRGVQFIQPLRSDRRKCTSTATIDPSGSALTRERDRTWRVRRPPAAFANYSG